MMRLIPIVLLVLSLVACMASQKAFVTMDSSNCPSIRVPDQNKIIKYNSIIESAGYASIDFKISAPFDGRTYSVYPQSTTASGLPGDLAVRPKGYLAERKGSSRKLLVKIPLAEIRQHTQTTNFSYLVASTSPEGKTCLYSLFSTELIDGADPSNRILDGYRSEQFQLRPFNLGLSRDDEPSNWFRWGSILIAIIGAVAVLDNNLNQNDSNKPIDSISGG